MNEWKRPKRRRRKKNLLFRLVSTSSSSHFIVMLMAMVVVVMATVVVLFSVKIIKHCTSSSSSSSFFVSNQTIYTINLYNKRRDIVSESRISFPFFFQCASTEFCIFFFSRDSFNPKHSTTFL